MKRLRSWLSLAAVAALASALFGSVPSAAAASPHMALDCSQGRVACTEVQDPEKVFGQGVYVGHDEPSVLFYSNQAGAGNRMQYQLTLPSDPPQATANAFNFQLHPAFWFGMAMCDTQSFPEQLTTCTPDSDSNIVDPAVSPNHPGVAFMEMQFYPPGWVKWPPGNSCDATKWCAALNIDSLSSNAVTNLDLNPTCAARTGVEYVNFAFITTNGRPQPNSPPNPVESTLQTFTPDPNADLFMNSGDRITVTMHDTAHGLFIGLNDLTSGRSGSMTTSARNGFGQVKYAPAPSTDCTNIPFDFHPMYSTSSELTRVTWAAHSYNIAFADETGHFDNCAKVVNRGNCSVREGVAGDTEPSDKDDVGCFDASQSSLVAISGCLGTNTGFDGVPYQANTWPNGDLTSRPSPILFSSPLTGAGYTINYSRAALEADLPRIEFSTCNRFVDSHPGCTLIPTTDDRAPASFYPYFSALSAGGQCAWAIGSTLGGNDFGNHSQWGDILRLTYTNGTGTIQIWEDFRNIMNPNPCPAG